MKLKNIRNWLLVTGALFASAMAHAESYSFDYLAFDGSYEVNGLLSTSDVLNAVNGFSILGITGTVTGNGGGAISSLVDNPNSPNAATGFSYTYDNNLFPASNPELNLWGVLFTTANGSTWNLWGTAPENYTLHSYTGTSGVEVHGNFVTTAVPEPESLAMMLAGLGLMGAVARRRKSKAV